MCYDNLINSWIKYYSLKENSIDRRILEERIFELDELIFDNPKKAFIVILGILDNCDDPALLSNLSSGPLESLLGQNGSQVIQLVEAEAKVNLKFKKLLKGTWQNLMTNDIWNRVQRSLK